MTIEPNELAAIKASVSAEMVLSGIARTEPARCEQILDAIDRAAAEASTRRVIMFDAETGEMIMPSEAATGEIWQSIAAQCLPGIPVELVAKAYGDWLEADTDPRPLGVGKRVKLREMPSLRGAVIRRVESEGELHTVVIAWDAQPGEFPYSPRELEEIQG
jgi:hypothetical protein